jgi:molybdopterin-guanine dinucleotide biosynthesis protein A
MEQVQAFILAGGRSSRMGSDKAKLELGDRTFVEIIAETLKPITSDVSLVGGAPNSTLSTVPDVYPDWGALGGLHAAISACTTPWAVVVACDLPFITRELISSLVAARDGYDAVVPIQPDGRAQPLCACYRVEQCMSTAATLIQAGKRRPLDLLDAVNTRWVKFAELKDLDQADSFFVNINTPEDYYEATRKV